MPGCQERRKLRMLRNCTSEELENVEHWLLRRTGMAEEREKLIMTMREKVEWLTMEDDKRVLQWCHTRYARRDNGIGRRVEKMWWKRFMTEA